MLGPKGFETTLCTPRPQVQQPAADEQPDPAAAQETLRGLGLSTEQWTSVGGKLRAGQHPSHASEALSTKALGLSPEQVATLVRLRSMVPDMLKEQGVEAVSSRSFIVLHSSFCVGHEIRFCTSCHW